MTEQHAGEATASGLAGDHELAQARLMVATEAAQLGLWDWDLTTDALVWDARSVTMYGQTEMPLTGRVSDINRTIHPDDQTRVAEELGDAIARKGTLETEFRVVHPDGTERVVYARGQALVDAAGDVVRVIGTNADVTEMRRAQREATRDAERMAGLVEVAHALGEATTEAEVLLVVNRAASSLLAAQGAALTLLVPSSSPGSPGTGVVRSLTEALGEDFSALVAELPADFPLPAVECVTTGTAWFVPERAEAHPRFAAGMGVWEASGVDAVACLPLGAGDARFGSLSVTFDRPHDWRDADQRLLHTFAALTGQALQRIAARSAETAALRAAQRSASQQAALVALASSLELATDEEEVLAVVTGGAVGLFGAQRTVLGLRDGDHLRVLHTDLSDGRARTAVAQVPGTLSLPMVDAAMTGRAHYLDDSDAAAALFADGEEVTRPLYQQAGAVASAALPLSAGGVVVGSLSLGFAAARTWGDGEKQVLEAFTALTAQALDRIRARQAEEAANAAVRRFSETLQRSLLTSPPAPDESLHIAVRYLPAAAEAQVGGDWYDAFLTGDGTTHLVVGDVTGHDRDAAAAMGQMRNLLRGIAHVTDAAPAQVLSSLDAAVHDLDVGAMATVVLATLERSAQRRDEGPRLLRWSSAGHPPPLLLRADGTVEHLEHDPDLLIGLDPAAVRHDHEVLLEAGATLLVYTDGLVERRGTPLQEGLDWLAGVVRELRDLDPEPLCDELLARVGADVEDDVAMVVVRVSPQGQPRPSAR